MSMRVYVSRLGGRGQEFLVGVRVLVGVAIGRCFIKLRMGVALSKREAFQKILALLQNLEMKSCMGVVPDCSRRVLEKNFNFS